MQVMENTTSPFEAISAEILHRLTGTSDKKIVQLIFKQYVVNVIEKKEVAEGVKYSVYYTVSEDSKENQVWEFVHHQNN